MRLAIGVAAAALLLAFATTAQSQPQVTYLFPEDGAVLAQPPPRIRLCFSDPINIRDLDKGGDFAFSVVDPDGLAHGHRIIFQPNGLGADILTGGISTNPPEGEWVFEWRVTDFYTLEPTEGSLRFTVSADGSPVPEEPPQACETGGTILLRTIATTTPSSDNGASQQEETDDDDGLGVPLIALIAAASLAGGAALGVVIYFALRRTGVRQRQPPSDEGPDRGAPF